ncbi:TonB-dependent receptor [Daejeonella sp.]|uniref:TonB-dependent receptor domain-containing protein n=1 Tax=Daejeonella sp. TaxID=2805397 RepID=UPI0030BBFDA3
MMRKVPLISIDGDDNIQVKGSSSYKILIDGRPSSLVARNPKEVLKNMSALNILRIEVITTPPAKYDSEGLAGIINIVTNKKMPGGYNGSVGTKYNTAFGPGTSASFTLKNKKFGFSTSGGLSHRGAQSLSFTESRSAPLNQFEQSGSRAYKGTFGYMSAELSYDIDTLNLITVSMAYNKNDGNIVIGSSNDRFDQFNILNQSYRWDNTIDYRWGGYDLGFNYQLGFKKNKSRLLTASYRTISNKDDQFAENSFYGLASPVDYRQQNKSGTKEQTIQLDYAHPLKKLNIEGGLKAISRNNFSDYGMQNFDSASQAFIININGTNIFDYQQDVISFYNSYQLKLDNWGFKAGLRLERTVVDANFASISNKFKLDYSNFIPSVSVQRKFKQSSLNFGYTQRIQRPGILQLNPYQEIRDKFVSSGNTELLPALSNNFDLSYSMFKKGSIVTNLSYSFTNNTIQNVTTLRGDTSYTTFANTGKNKNLSASMNVNYPLTKRLQLYLFPLISYLNMEGMVNNKVYKNEGIQWIAYTYLSYKFDKDWQVGFNIGYQNGVMFLQGKSDPYNWTVMSLSKDFLKKKASLSALIYNPFERFANWGVETKSPEFTLRKDHAQFYRQAGLSFNYRFGKLKDQLNKNKRGINNDDNSGRKNRGIVGEL